MAEILFFTGKGGTGKTTLSTINAINKSLKNKKVLLVSIDPAHSLSDILKIAKYSDEQMKNLTIIEIDIQKEAENYIKNALDLISNFITGASVKKIETMIEQLTQSPGSEEAVIMETISKIIKREEGKFDYIIFDTAPSGHLLNLIKDIYYSGILLETIYKESGRIFHLKKLQGKELPDIPSIIKERYERIKKVGEYIKDKKAKFVIVMNPDYLSLEETKRLVKNLENMNASIKAIVVNKIFGKNFPEEHVENQQGVIKEIENTFKNYELIKVNYLNMNDIFSLNIDL